MKVIDVEQCPEKNKKREDYNRRADDAVDNQDAVGGEVAPYLVDKPCKTVPPQQRSKHDAQIAHAHFKRMVGHNECQLGVTSHEKEYNKRVGECYEECCDAVVNQRALLVPADMDFLCGVALEAIDAEQEEHDASAYLKIKEIAAFLDELHHETHAETCDESIENVAHGGADASHETIPTPLV